MEFQPDAILAESNEFRRLVRHHGLRRVSARPFSGSRPPDAVSVLLPRLLPDAQNTGRAAAPPPPPPPPQDRAWGAFDNPYDRRAYERICNEFGVSPHTNWRVKAPNNGLGRVYFYGYVPVGGGVGPSGHYNSAKMSFTKPTTNDSLHVDFITQDDPDADYAWTTFVLDKSEGFTQPGVERINDSIRTYVWAILGAQAQARTSILGTGTAFDAQK